MFFKCGKRSFMDLSVITKTEKKLKKFETELQQRHLKSSELTLYFRRLETEREYFHHFVEQEIQQYLLSFTDLEQEIQIAIQSHLKEIEEQFVTLFGKALDNLRSSCMTRLEGYVSALIHSLEEHNLYTSSKYVLRNLLREINFIKDHFLTTEAEDALIDKAMNVYFIAKTTLHYLHLSQEADTPPDSRKWRKIYPLLPKRNLGKNSVCSLRENQNPR